VLTRYLFVKHLINSGQDRSVKTKKNILALFVIKGGSITISFILVPLTLNYVNQIPYCTGLTLTTVIGWFSFFDIGLGNGLRNKFAQAVAKQEFHLARIYVSTTYSILTIIIIVLSILFFFINPFLDWSKILNTPASLSSELSILAFLIFCSFCLQLVLQLITTILTANQEPGKASFINLVGNFIALMGIFLLTKITNGSLIYLGIILAFSPCLVLLISSFILFKTSYKRFTPSIKFVDFTFAKDLFKIGGAFFIIQIGAIVLFQTDNILISQLFGPIEVTTFSVAYKLFTVSLLIFTIVMTPLWSAFTEAYEKNDMIWIKKVFSKTKRYWLYLIFFTLLLFIASPLIFRIWIGNSIQVPMILSLVLSIFVIGNSWMMIHCFLLNGISKIRLQLFLYILTMLINIPLAYLFGKIFGITGIVLSNILIYIMMGVTLSIQCNKILNNSANGIWNK